MHPITMRAMLTALKSMATLLDRKRRLAIFILAEATLLSIIITTFLFSFFTLREKGHDEVIQFFVPWKYLNCKPGGNGNGDELFSCYREIKECDVCPADGDQNRDVMRDTINKADVPYPVDEHPGNTETKDKLRLDTKLKEV